MDREGIDQIVILCYNDVEELNGLNMRKINPGDRFGNLVAIKEIPRTNPKKRRFLWLCDCGKEHESNLVHVTTGNTISCGCHRDTRNREQGKLENSSNWKGGRRIEDKYVLVYKPGHPNAKPNGYIREHTLVMSEYLGRPLIKGENVHHKNGVRCDNRIENLELWSTSQPPGQRVIDKLNWAKEIIERYKDYVETGSNPDSGIACVGEIDLEQGMGSTKTY